MYQQSNGGTWHKVGGAMNGKNLPVCQSYNLDRPNYLKGEVLPEPPEGAKRCRKCAKPDNAR